jgi:hypothetical protein
VDVAPIDKIRASELVERYHYLHRRPPISHAFGLWETLLNPVGVCTFGTPASRHLQISACPSDPGLVVELNRLWVDDDQPRNTESWFVSRCLKQLPPLIVVSYADTTQGHLGYIYRALNFKYAGWTDMERKTPRLDYVPLSGGHSREATRSGIAERVRRSPKVKYWTTTGNKRERAELARLCGWPSYSWVKIPPPTEREPVA